MINNYTVPTQDRDNYASVTTNQMMPLVAQYTTPEFTESSINNNYYAPHITTAPVVKSHHPISVFTVPIGAIPQQQQQQQITSLDLSTTNMMMNSMDLDDYFTGNNHNLLNMYSPSSTTTNNSSNMMIDQAMSPTSPQPLDTLSNFHSQLVMTDNTMLPIPTVPHPIPFQDDQSMMYHHHFHQPQPYPNHRRTLPRRHTVSTPYTTTTPIKPNKPEPVTKSRKSSLKAKRHRSLGKIDIYASTTPPPMPDLLSAKLELWTHEQLLER
ncbi:hypothetical protein CU098_002332, partial [Rhizopus stolonifer]